MGYKSVIGCGKTNFDTIQLGYPATITSLASYSGTTLTLNLTGLVNGTPAGKSGDGENVTLTSLTGSDGSGGANLASLNGQVYPIITGGAGASTIAITVPAGLGITAITGGNVAFAGAGGSFSNNNALAYTQYGPVGGPICTAAWSNTTPSVTPAQGVLNNHAAHTASGMGLYVSNLLYPSATIVNRLSVNGVAGNQSVSIGPSTPINSFVSDATHTDAVPAGVTLGLTQGFSGTGVQTGYYVFTGIFWEADQPGGASVQFANTVANGNKTGGESSSSSFYGVTGSIYNNNAHLGTAQVMMPTAGVWSNLQMNIYQNVGVSNTNPGQSAPFQSCVSPTWQGSSSTFTAGNQVLTVPGGTYGILDDATGTDAVPAGSWINTTFSWSLSYDIYYSAFGSTWTSTQKNVIPWTTVNVEAAGAGSGLTNCSMGYTLPRTGALTYGQQPVETSSQLPVGCTFSQATVGLTASGGAGATFRTAPNLNAGNQTGALPSTPGTVTDATHTDAVPAGQVFDMSFNGMTGSYSLASMSALLMTPMPAGPKFRFDSLMFLGVG
jgi:hypothetical protein